MKGLVRTLIALAALAAAAAQAQDIRLYAFSSGALTLGRGILQNLAPVDPPIQIPVGFYLVRHPRGNVLFDTGNNDRLITDPNYWPPALAAMKPAMTPDVAIDVQLRKAGVSPDDITYVVASHMHLDHGGNVSKFPKSTLVV
jgi:glyoxylase-like metal-dependent hydrolase (beta-lactamase superfamily II)